MPNIIRESIIRDGLAEEIRFYTESAVGCASTPTLMAMRSLLIDLSSGIEFLNACSDSLGLPVDVRRPTLVPKAS